MPHRPTTDCYERITVRQAVKVTNLLCCFCRVNRVEFADEDECPWCIEKRRKKEECR